MSKGDLKAFHAAFKAADAGLDKKVCKNGSASGTDDAKKCNDKTATSGGLDKVYEDAGFDKVKAEAGPNIATSLSKLSKEEKATPVVSINTVRDNTGRLGLGIGRLSKGDLKAFHAAFKAADADLDKKVCKNGSDGGDAKKCNKKDEGGLEKVYEEANADFDKSKAEAGGNIATSLSKLSKEEKATPVVSINKVRDNTRRLGIGIGRLSKGDLKAFHAAFKAADADLDGKVCKNVSGNGEDAEKAKKCEANNTKGGLEKVYRGM